MTAVKNSGTLVNLDAVEDSELFLGSIKSRAFWPYVVSGGTVNAETMEGIVQSAADIFLAHFTSA